ncbi:MAG TPA: class I tRNA ligase family protein [Kofleriaceae bacterium]|jgi:methionyl-tRNA synthetase
MSETDSAARRDIVIQRLDPAGWTRSYGVLRQAIQPWAGRAEAPFGLAWCRLAPGEASMLHNHHEGETFYIASGAGVLSGVDTTTPVTAGDAIFLPALAGHSLRNTSDRDELQFVAIYWSDVGQLRDRVSERTATAPTGAGPRRTLIIPAFPTPNGDFHLGHLSGPYLAADALARFRRLQGDDVCLVTGTDDHQTYVVTRSWRDGRPPHEVADHFASVLDDTLRTARIEPSLSIRLHGSAVHAAAVARFFRRIYDRGHFVAREVDAAFCERCDMVLFGGYIEGRCPSCGGASDGSICERCSHPNDCIDLVEPRCTRCTTPASRRRIARLYFPLEPHRERLRAHLDRVAMVPRARSMCQRLLERRLPEIAVTHPTRWGIPVPVEGMADQRIDVWLEVIAGYLSAAETAAGAAAAPVRWNDPGTEIIQCSGIDNTFFHGLYFPALLAAHDPSTALPRAVISNEFLLLEGEKLSTSRSHAVWARDLIAESCADAVRMYLAWNRPEIEPTTFSRHAFEAFTATELVERWDGWLAALGARLERHAGFAADGAESWSGDHERFYAQLVRAVDRCAACYRVDGFTLQEAARAACDVVRIAARFGAAMHHMAGVAGADDAVRTSLALELTAAKAVAVVASPLMPDFARWLWGALGLSATPMTWAEATTIFPYGVAGMQVGAYFAPRTLRAGS